LAIEVVKLLVKPLMKLYQTGPITPPDRRKLDVIKTDGDDFFFSNGSAVID
jgi:hypothetical protein